MGVTTVIVPFNHRADIPVLSYQMIINAMGMRCQPRRVYTTTDWIASPVDPWGFNFALARRIDYPPSPIISVRRPRTRLCA